MDRGKRVAGEGPSEERPLRHRMLAAPFPASVARVPAVGSLEALFAEPPAGLRTCARSVTRTRSGGIIDEIREALMASKNTGQVLHSQLATSDRRVMELDVELRALHPVAEVVSDLIRARDATLAERLQEIPARVYDAVERGMYRSASEALAAAQFCSGLDPRGLVGFPDGQGATDHEGLVDSFEDTAEAVVTEVPTEQILREAH